MCLSLGTKRLAELAQKLEDLGRARNVNDAPALLRELETAFAQTKAQLLTLRAQ
jgi:HPt (histidine-containing phosphotransfer) domain-containing protein